MFTETLEEITTTTTETAGTDEVSNDITSGSEMVLRVYMDIEPTTENLAEYVESTSDTTFSEDDQIRMVAIVELPDGRKVQGEVIELVLEQ